MVRALEYLILLAVPAFAGLFFAEVLGFWVSFIVVVLLCSLWAAINIILKPASPNLRLTPRRLSKVYREHYPPYENADVLRYREPGRDRDYELPCAVLAYANPRDGSRPRTQIQAKWDNDKSDETWSGPTREVTHWFDQARKIYERANPSATDNQVVRLMDVHTSSDPPTVTCLLKKSRFFFTAATNRSADCRLVSDADGNQTTVRKIFEPGPRLRDLRVTQAGNHLGVNLLVLTKDSMLILKRRQRTGVAHRIGELDSSGSGAIDLRHDLKNDEEVRDIVNRAALREFRDEVGEEIPVNGDVEFLGLCREFSRLGKPDAFYFAETSLTFLEAKKEWERRPLEHLEGIPIPLAFYPKNRQMTQRCVRFGRRKLTSPGLRFLSRLGLAGEVVSVPLAIHLALLGLYLGHLNHLPGAEAQLR